jgi:hypothetical protein
MKKLIFTLLALNLQNVVIAAPLDVKPANIKEGDLYVRVTKNTSPLSVSFEKCRWKLESTTCENLGNKNSYTIRELENQRSIEADEFTKSSIAAGVAIAAITISGTGGVTILTMKLASASGGVLGMLAGVIPGAVIGAGASITGGIALTKYVDALNPKKQKRQELSIGNNVINDEDVTENNMQRFVEELETVLNKI